MMFTTKIWQQEVCHPLIWKSLWILFNDNIKIYVKQCEDLESSGNFSQAFHLQRPVFYDRLIRVGFLVGEEH